MFGKRLRNGAFLIGSEVSRINLLVFAFGLVRKDVGNYPFFDEGGDVGIYAIGRVAFCQILEIWRWSLCFLAFCNEHLFC